MRSVRRAELDFRQVLEKLASGPAVLKTVDEAHRLVEKEGVRAVDAAKLVMRHFTLSDSPPAAAFLKFVDFWQTKPIVETGIAAEFLDYLDST